MAAVDLTAERLHKNRANNQYYLLITCSSLAYLRDKNTGYASLAT